MKNKQRQLTNPNQSDPSLFLKLCGFWAAIFAPAMIVIIAFIIPFGDVMTRSYILKLMGMPAVKLFLFLMISLPIWYGLYRVLAVLHYFNLYPHREKLLTYGLALAWTLHAGYILFMS
ncbi:succinate dehydrogenase subunit D [Orbus hercynius]|uniref:Succinate dehydrogenase subunit D n=2 Tax=Orbus hercynius TaxID=593135 RepID=A0A495RCP6_9GAMM|nr:succinate dehydrogenase subunit D [Orbus hercynius]